MQKFIPALVREDEETLRKKFEYPIELQLGFLQDIKMKSYKSYKIVEVGTTTYIAAEWFLDYVNSGDKSRANFVGHLLKSSINKYDLSFKQEEILGEILKLNVNDSASILRFCNNYGLIFENPKRDKETLLDSVFEKFNFFLYEIIKVKHCVALHVATQNNDYNFLKTEPFTKEIFEKIGGTELDHWILAGNAAKNSLINERLAGVHPRLLISEEGKKSIAGILAKNPIGYIYYELSKVVANNTKFEKCQCCGNFFTPNKGNHSFCPTSHPGKRSSCENNYSKMKRRAREYYFIDGLSVEEIHNKINRPKKPTIEEIFIWIDAYKGNLK